jgi:molybdopterin-synthase adenylyltransferase
MQFEGIPRVKSTIQYYQLDGNVFFASTGSALQIEDPTGFLAAICENLDGKKNISAIESELASKHPKEVQYFSDALQALNAVKLIENAELKPGSALNDYDVQRWSRNTDFFGAFASYGANKFESQARLKNVKVTLLGLGGLGSHILYDLAALGVQHIKAVDFDRIELSNLNRQILYNKTDIGKLKTEVAKKRMKEFLPEGDYKFINKKLDSQQDVDIVVKNTDVVICVADRPRKNMLGWVNHSCVKYGIPYINGGLDTKRAIFFSVIPGISGCAECWKQFVARQNSITSKLNQIELQDGPQGPLGPAIVPFVSILTGLMLSEFIKIVTGISEVQTINHLTAFDFESLRLNPVEMWEKLDNCLVCSMAHILKK